MGLFLCDVCLAQLEPGSMSPHVCDPEKARKHAKYQEDRAIAAEGKLEVVRNAVFMLLHQLPSLNTEQVNVSGEWLRNLWKAADCQWDEVKTADSFLVRWMATHRILRESFRLFRSKNCGKVESLLSKLQLLRQACDKAKEVLGYQDSKFDLTPEDVLK